MTNSRVMFPESFSEKYVHTSYERVLNENKCSKAMIKQNTLDSDKQLFGQKTRGLHYQ